jgi:hypothetical protein
MLGRRKPEKIMAGIRPTGGTEITLRASRRREQPGRAKRIDPVPVTPSDSRAKTALGRPDISARPVAAFLAQYIDQHWAWPRNASRKEETRRTATAAYIEADMLPDLLAETLRPARRGLKL